MRHLLTLLAALFLCATAQAQTMKALMYNTTNGQVAYNGTNGLRFVESVAFSSDVFGFSFEAASGSNYTQLTPDGVDFSGDAQRTTTRANLGFSTNLNTLWTATNARTAARALSGSTNTNHPFSGTISVVGTNNTNTLTFSNGILQSVQ